MASEGYDYVFTPDLPDDYIFVICHLASKNPKQIEICGHQFCHTCFDDMRKSSIADGNQMYCPVDTQTFLEDQNHVLKCNSEETAGKGLEGMNANLKSINTSLTKFEEAVEKSLTSVNEKFDSVNSEVKEIRNQVSQLKECSEVLSGTVLDLKIHLLRMVRECKPNGPSDPRTLSALSNLKWEWRCPMFKKKDFNYFSPEFYFKNWCFKLCLKHYKCSHEENTIGLFLHRWQDIFDNPESCLDNYFPRQYDIVLSIEDSYGNWEETKLEKVPRYIKMQENSSIGKGARFKSCFNYLCNWSYHTRCEILEK